MRIPVIVGMLLASVYFTQAQAANPLPDSAVTQTPSAAQTGTITIPQGTRIPLALSAALTTKSARRGSTIRAVTTFPVTVGSEVAIPVGTYVEGTIDRVSKSARTGPSMRVHFTRLVFSSGYSVTVDASNTQAQLLKPESPAPVYADGFVAGGITPHYVLAAQTTGEPPTLQPIPQPQTHEGLFIGLGIGSAVATILAVVLAAHHNGGAYNGILFDTGWQFEMVLQSPVSVNSANVSAAPAGAQ